MLVALCALMALAYMPLSTRPTGALRSLLKTLSVAGLALAALMSGAGILSAALLLCSLGDLLLSRDGDTAFRAGIVAFAAGHIAYVILFVTDPASDMIRLAQFPGLWWVAPLTVIGMGMAVLLVRHTGDLRLPVLAYIPIILAMVMAALTLPRTGALIWVLPSALAFMCSDMVLALERFLLPADHPAARFTPYIIWSLYWGAQLGFLFAFG